jgi:hypothetical protein
MSLDVQEQLAFSTIKGDDHRCVAYFAAALKKSVSAEIQAGFDEYCVTLTDQTIQKRCYFAYAG